MSQTASVFRRLSQLPPVFSFLFIPIQSYVLHLSGSVVLIVFGSLLGTGLHMTHISRNYYHWAEQSADRKEEDESQLVTWNFCLDGATICRVIPKPHISIIAMYPVAALLFGLLRWLLDIFWPATPLLSPSWFWLTFDGFCLTYWYWLSFKLFAAIELRIDHRRMDVGATWFLLKSRQAYDLQDVTAVTVHPNKNNTVIELQRHGERPLRVKLNVTDNLTVRNLTACLVRYRNLTNAVALN
jgi:hypothetical protein